jgi:hypothetical protein
MPILRKLQEYLDEHKIKYQILTHSTAYTAQEVTQMQHVPGKMLAKVVMVKKEAGTPVMLVLPASHKVDFAQLREVLGTQATLEQEREFRALFARCETGAEPPFAIYSITRPWSILLWPRMKRLCSTRARTGRRYGCGMLTMSASCARVSRSSPAICKGDGLSISRFRFMFCSADFSILRSLLIIGNAGRSRNSSQK